MTARQIVLMAQVVLLVLWPPTAWAATLAFGQTFAAMPALAWALVWVLSTVSGGTALLGRVQRELQRCDATGQELPRPGLLVGSHLAGSWLAGLIAFLLGLEAGQGEVTTALAVIVASFTGARFVEAFAAKMLPPPPPPEAAP